MRIISNFKDYYDCIMGVGGYNEDDIKYLRHKKEDAVYHSEFPTNRVMKFGPTNFDCDYDIVGFCGKLYPMFTLKNHSYSGYCYQGTKEAKCFTMEEIDNTVKEWFPKSHEHFKSPKRGLRAKEDLWRYSRYSEFEKFFTDVEAVDEHPFFEKYKTPIFVAYLSGPWVNSNHARLLVINERLNQLNFQKVFDPAQAFQKISMYLGNMAFPNRPIPEVSNDDLIAAKGFDKFSFRKDKKPK